MKKTAKIQTFHVYTNMKYALGFPLLIFSNPVLNLYVYIISFLKAT